MTNEEAEAITLFERRLTEWMKEQPVTVEWSLMALGISAARLIFGSVRCLVKMQAMTLFGCLTAALSRLSVPSETRNRTPRFTDFSRPWFSRPLRRAARRKGETIERSLQDEAGSGLVDNLASAATT